MTIPGAQYIGDKVAVRYYQPIPKLLTVRGLGDIYFQVKMGISLALVDESIVPRLLAIRGGCCGRNRQIVQLASPEARNLWYNGTRDGKVK
jgi:hypothetical protein